MRDPAIEQALVDDHAATARRETLEEVEALVKRAMNSNWWLSEVLEEIQKLPREDA